MCVYTVVLVFCWVVFFSGLCVCVCGCVWLCGCFLEKGVGVHLHYNIFFP